MKHIVVISDTHGNIDERFVRYLKKADEIFRIKEKEILTV